MKKSFTIVVAFLFACGISSNALALTIKITDSGVVGAASQETAPAGTLAQVTALSQFLLNMTPPTKSPTGCDLAGSSTCYATSSIDYNATLAVGTTLGASTSLTGYSYVLAKYNGAQGGYVLINVAAAGFTTVADIPDWENVFSPIGARGFRVNRIVGFTTTTSVPDGGATVALLGAALSALALVRRRMNG